MTYCTREAQAMALDGAYGISLVHEKVLVLVSDKLVMRALAMHTMLLRGATTSYQHIAVCSARATKHHWLHFCAMSRTVHEF